MEALFKKYFWVLNLVVLSVVAWILAQTITDYVAMKYLSSRASDAAAAGAVSDKPLLTKAPADRIANELSRRSPLNVDAKPKAVIDKPKDCKASCEGKECGGDGCGGSCGECKDDTKCNEGKCEATDEEPQESELNIQLVGTMSSPADPSIRFANIILDGGDSDMVTIGAELLDGKAKVLDIQSKIIYLREGDKLTHVGLWAEASTKKKAPDPKSRVRGGRLKRPAPGRGASAKPKPRSPNRGRNFDYSTGVKKTGDFAYNIDKQMLDEQLTDLTQLGMQARVIPNYRKGKYEGFKLVGVRPGSLYRAIGIRSGDIIRSINGKAINSPNKAMELFTQLKNSSGINMEVERRGKIENFNYNIQ